MGEWSDMMTQTVTVAPVDSVAADGTRTSGAQTSIDCRIEYEGHAVWNQDGQVIGFRDKILTHDAIDSDAMIWLPDDDTSSDADARSVYRRKRLSDPTGGEDVYEVVV